MASRPGRPGRWPHRRGIGSSVLVEVADLAIRPTLGAPVLASQLAFSIKVGGITGLSGPSGIGKTTLGDTLLGLRQPAAGRIKWKRAVDVQKLYQDPGAAFAPWRPVRATMSDALATSKGGRARLDDLCRPLFKQLNLTHDLLERRPDAVSGGELQRLSLARALLCRPGLIFADEPTSRLDAITQRAFAVLLSDAASDGVAVLLASHDGALLANVADSVITLV